ncbi:endonuclease domain-containing protein [Nocardia lasii]|uniref:Endonuclease domain-containing protein n=1 Tax=Nocardia lasii TaxID=1616107 RepID=A0ABW1JY22_9NOCA
MGTQSHENATPPELSTAPELSTIAPTGLDGREFHSDAVVFRRDRRRQNWLVVRGWLVLRYAAQDVMHNLDQCADEVQRVVLARRKVAKTCSRLRFGPEIAASGE